MDIAILAYLAGVMDSDGCFMIRRSTYAKRVRGDAQQPVFSERATIKQVEPQAIDLLHSLYGGARYVYTPPKGRALICADLSDRRAASLARDLLPYLRIKRRQAEILGELRASKDDARLRKAAYWFGEASPSAPAYTVEEAAAARNTSPESVRQAVYNGSIPVFRRGRRLFISKEFWDAWSPTVGGHGRPPQLIALRQRLYEEICALNSPLGRPARRRAVD